MNAMPLLKKQVEQHPYPLIFATISGAHLYGFPSPDSDYDLRGVHVLPLKEVVGLKTGQETIEKSGIHDGLEIDLVTHDAKKFFSLMLKKNGYVLEQVFSPLIVHTTPEHAELIEIAKNCVTKHHAHHYLGFAETQWKLFEKESPPRVKPLLYVYPRKDRQGGGGHKVYHNGVPDQKLVPLDAHHITDRNDLPNGGYVEENGITLCDDGCHLLAEVYHQTGTPHPGFSPKDLYARIGKSYEEAYQASLKLA